jgi:hypothetical protein
MSGSATGCCFLLGTWPQLAGPFVFEVARCCAIASVASQCPQQSVGLRKVRSNSPRHVLTEQGTSRYDVRRGSLTPRRSLPATAAIHPVTDTKAADLRVRFGPKGDSCSAANIRHGLTRGDFRVLVCRRRPSPAAQFVNYIVISPIIGASKRDAVESSTDQLKPPQIASPCSSGTPAHAKALRIEDESLLVANQCAWRCHRNGLDAGNKKAGSPVIRDRSTVLQIETSR